MIKRYTSAGFTIDLQHHTLIKKGLTTQVRPRTFALLGIFLSHPGQLLSKETLLASVWDDVVVDEQVLFQSIRELRQLFAGADVIKTHPRKGYTWIADVSSSAPTQRNIAFSLPASSIKFLPISAIVLVLIGGIALSLYRQQPDRVGITGSVIILPVKTAKKSLDYRWVKLGAMDQLIARLQSKDSIAVRSTEVALDLMHQAGLTSDYSSREVAKLFKVTGAGLIVETKLLGNIEEFQLTYKLHFRNDIKTGVVFAETIDQSLQQLAAVISQYTGQELSELGSQYESDFSDELLARAIEYKYQNRHEEARNLLASLLDINPHNLIARRYYAEMLIYAKQYPQADKELSTAITLSNQYNPKERPRIHYTIAELKFFTHDLQGALQQLKAAMQHAEKYNDWLYQGFSAYLSGRIHEQLNNTDQAQRDYESALEHFGDVHCPISRSRTRLQLARLFSKQQKIPESSQHFTQAKHLISRYQLAGMQPFFDTIKHQLDPQVTRYSMHD